MAKQQDPTRLEALSRAFLEAQLDGDRRTAVALVVAGVAEGISPRTVELEVLQPAQREIGRLWEANVITVAREHVATSIAQLALAQLYPHLPRAARRGKRALVACVAGEQHDMGARMGADFLEMEGFDVTFAGADVPTHEIVAAVEREHPDVLGLSAATSFQEASLREAVAAVRALRGPAFPIVVGGAVFTWKPELARELGVHAAGTCADVLSTACSGLFR